MFLFGGESKPRKTFPTKKKQTLMLERQFSSYHILARRFDERYNRITKIYYDDNKVLTLCQL